MIEFRVRELPLPAHVEGVTLPFDDGTFDVFINSLMSQEKKRDALRHEIKHISGDHFYSDDSVSDLEKEADDVPAEE